MNTPDQQARKLGTRNFWVGDWAVHPTLHQVCRDGRVVILEPKVLLLLVALAEAGGDAVSRDDLHRLVWPDTFVTDKALTSSVAKLRKALGDAATSPRYVATVARGGYRLVAPITMDDRGLAPPPGAEPASARRIAIAAGVVVAGAVLVAGAVWQPGADDHRARPAAITLTTEDGFELHPALSPGGETVAYSRADEFDNWDLYLHRPGADTALRLTDDPARDVRPVWSPDGSRIAFLRFTDSECHLMTMSALGGPAIPLAWCAEFVPAQVFWGPKIAWSPDGRLIAWPWRDAADEAITIRTVDIATGETQELTRPSVWHADANPAFSSDGRWLAFSRRRNGGPGDLWIVPLDEDGRPAGEERQLSFDHRGMMGHTWMPGSEEVLMASNRSGTFNLWAFAVEGGTPRWIPAPGENLKEPTLSTDGRRIVYENWNYDENIWRLDLEAPGPAAADRLIDSSLWDSGPTYSPDGAAIAFVSNRSGSYEVWASDANGKNERRLTDLASGVIGPLTWRRDSSAIVFEARPNGVANLYQVAAAGGTAERLTDERYDDVLPYMGPDGATLWFASNRSGQWQVWSMPADGGAAIQTTRAGGYAARISGDGELLLFTRPSHDGLWARSPNSDDARLLISSLSGRDFGNWTVHGQRVFFVRRTGPGGQAELAVHDLGTGATRALFVPTGAVLASRRGLSVSPDGRWLLFTVLDDATSDLVLVRDLLLK